MKKIPKGISLIEILLVIVVAASIIIASLLYYTHTLLHQHVSQAINQLQMISQASYEWLQLPDENGNSKADFSSFQNETGLEQLSALNLISCIQKSCEKNPWGGELIVTADSNTPQYVKVILTQISDKGCLNLLSHMQDVAIKDPNTKKPAQECSKDNTTYTVYL